MKLVMISTDRGLLNPQSKVSERFRAYGRLFEQLDVIVFAMGTFDDVQLAENVVVHPTNSSTRSRYFADANRIGRALPADVFSSQDPFETGIVAYRLAKLHQAKLHIQVHTDIFSEGFRTHSILNYLRTFIARWLLPKAHSIRVVSARIKASLEQVGSIKVEPVVLPIVVEMPQEVTPITFPFAQTILTVSRLEKEKNVHLLIDAFAQVRRTHPEIGLIIVGSGSLRSALEAQVTHLDIASAVRFAGTVTDVFDYYHGADIYAQCSSYEGYGMSLIEAALSGLPILTTDVGVVGEVLVDGGSALVTQPTVQDIAMKLTILLEEDALRSTMGGRAQEAAQAHTLSQDEYLERFKEAFTIA